MGLVAAAAVGAVGAVGGGLIAAGGAKSAAKANQQAADAATAETRAGREQAYSTLNPFVQGGTAAGGQINALLGLGDNTNWAEYVNADPAAVQDWQTNWAGGEGALGNKTIDEYGQFHYNLDGKRRDLTPFQNNGMAGFDQFRNSTGYQFRLGEGMNALNSGYAGAGTIKSGAAMRAATEYGQNFASGEFGNYLNALGNQQATGLQAGSAAAGVGVNAANSLGNIAMQNGANQANAGLVRASAIGQGFAGTANALGTILGPQQNNMARLTPSALSTINSNPGLF